MIIGRSMIIERSIIIEPNGNELYGTGLFQTGPFRTELAEARLFKTGALFVRKSANKSSGTHE